VQSKPSYSPKNAWTERLTALVVVVSFAACVSPARSTTPSCDRERVIGVVNGVGTSADSHDWAEGQSYFVDTPFIDYSSLSGQPGAKVRAADLIKQWSSFLPKFRSTKHRITDHDVKVNGSTAICHSNVHASHYLPGAKGGDRWEVYGSYDHELVRVGRGFKISKMVFHLLRQEGNVNLPKELSRTESLDPALPRLPTRAVSTIERFFANYGLIGSSGFEAFRIAQSKLLSNKVCTTVIVLEKPRTYSAASGYFASIADWSKVFRSGPDFGFDIDKRPTSSGEILVRLKGRLSATVNGTETTILPDHHAWQESFRIDEDGLITSLRVEMRLSPETTRKLVRLGMRDE